MRDETVILHEIVQNCGEAVLVAYFTCACMHKHIASQLQGCLDYGRPMREDDGHIT